MNNRAALRAQFAQEPLFLFTANLPLQRTESTAYSFRQGSNFWYLTGVNQPGTLLLMHQGKEYLILPELDEVQLLFGGVIDQDQLAQSSGINNFLTWREGRKKIRELLSQHSAAVTLAPLSGFNKHENSFNNPAERQLYRYLQRLGHDLRLTDARRAIAEMRAIKQPEEIKEIKASINITVAAFDKVQQNINDFNNEKQIQNLLTSEFALAGAVHAYEPIVASGLNACTLHYAANDKAIASGEAILIDAGVELNNYAADITRTYFCGQPSARYQEIYQAVTEVKSFALNQLKAGLSWRDYELSNLDFAAEQLQQLGVIKEKDRRLARQYYPHATSHSLGLDVHDVGISYDKPLAAGMVITVEPGLYIPDERIGVRLEDDVLITSDGYQNLVDFNSY